MTKDCTDQDVPTPISSTDTTPPVKHLTIDECLLKFNTRVNVVLITEVLLGFLVLYTTDTFSFYGNSVDYTKWSCVGTDPDPSTVTDNPSLCSANATFVYNKTNFCRLLNVPGFSFEWNYGSGASFSTEFGMYCRREDESQTILEISGIGAGLGAVVGGIMCDLLGRKTSFGFSFVMIEISLITLTFCQTVQIFTIGLFLLGFSVYMSLTSLMVLSIELLPTTLHLPFLIMTLAPVTCCGPYVGYLMRIITYYSWRALSGSMIALNLCLIPLMVHLPRSPRYKVEQDTRVARATLAHLKIGLEEDESLIILGSPPSESVSPTGSSPRDQGSPPLQTGLLFDYRTHKLLLATTLVLFFLTAVVGMTSTPSAGKVWELVFDDNVANVIKATLQLFAAFPAALIFVKNINIRFSILLLGWIAIGSYFIGELPIGTGMFNINNSMGLILLPLNRTMHILLTLLILQLCPTCYRATLFGTSLLVDQCFIKIGSLISQIDYMDLPHPQLQEDRHDTSFLVFGVAYLSYVYVASYLPQKARRLLPNNMAEFNLNSARDSEPRAGHRGECTYLLRDLAAND